MAESLTSSRRRLPFLFSAIFSADVTATHAPPPADGTQQLADERCRRVTRRTDGSTGKRRKAKPLDAEPTGKTKRNDRHRKRRRRQLERQSSLSTTEQHQVPLIDRICCFARPPPPPPPTTTRPSAGTRAARNSPAAPASAAGPFHRPELKHFRVNSRCI